MLYSLYDLLFFFFIYAFIGWCTEVVFAACKHGAFVNRGFLNGPVCPIYGFGVVIVILVLLPLKENLAALFFGSVLLTTALEFIVGFALEKIFNDKWWDYSREPFNIKGYICLRFSLIWGLACVFAIDVVHPLIDRLVGLIPHTLGLVALAIFSATILIDTVFASGSAWTLKKQLHLLAEARAELKVVSDAIGGSLAEGAINAKEKAEEGKEKFDDLREEGKEKLDDLREESKEKLDDLREESKEKLDDLREEGKEKLDDLQEAFGELREKLADQREQRKAKLEAREAELTARLRELVNDNKRGHRRLLRAFERYGQSSDREFVNQYHHNPKKD